MTPLPLFSANMLLLSVFAISFLAISFSARPNRHWRSWAAANALSVGALASFASLSALPPIATYLLPNILLLAGFGFHLHAARSLKQVSTPYGVVIAPAGVYIVVAALAYVFEVYDLAYVASNLLFAALCISIAATYGSAAFRGLVSSLALIIAFGLLALEAGLRILHGVLAEGPFGPGMIDDGTVNIHLMISLIFIAISGAFSMAISFEQLARNNHEDARRDPLTGTFNRREFLRRLEGQLQPATGAHFGLIQFDLDHFKQVNDRFGHVAGDEALVKVCQAIRHHLRRSDCFARLGGEEFGLLLPNVGQEDAVVIAERIRKLVENQSYEFAPDGFQITISGGMYHGTGESLTPTDLFKIVDTGLYTSKNAGRNRITMAAQETETPKFSEELAQLDGLSQPENELQSAV
ncbi:GGDEF domain-containing protein [Roseibium alexandrii]|uniref:GGDEF domain-containing protein n=1 Tax=Roseibium alexandrii TaxID=388408 RepID=UPI003752218B